MAAAPPPALQERLALLDLARLEAQCVAAGGQLVEPPDSGFREPLSHEEVDALYVYEQPGDEPPMDLAARLGVPLDAAALASPTCRASQRLWRLNRTVERLQAALGPGADWLGIYRVIETGLGYKALLKEAYRGSISRGLFPLTEEFAKGSNNSTCAMTRRATIVSDTSALFEDQPYYV